MNKTHSEKFKANASDRQDGSIVNIGTYDAKNSRRMKGRSVICRKEKSYLRYALIIALG